MNTNLITGILIPFAGTSLGAACVLFMKKGLNERIQRVLTGFAAGVMVAASIWSLLLPAIEQSESMGKLSFFPAVVGFWIGILFLLLLDHIIPHLHMNSTSAEGPQTNLGKSAMMVLAVVLHNSGRHGSRRRLCRLECRKQRHHIDWRTGIVYRHCDTKFTGRSNHFHAPSCRGDE